MKKLLAIFALSTLVLGCNHHIYTQGDMIYKNGRLFIGTKSELLPSVKCNCTDYHQPEEPETVVVLRTHTVDGWGLSVYAQDHFLRWQEVVFKLFKDKEQKDPRIIKVERKENDGVLVSFADNTEELFLFNKNTKHWEGKDGSSIIDMQQAKE